MDPLSYPSYSERLKLHIQCKGKVIGCLERRYFGIVLHGSIHTTCVFDSRVQIPGEESIIQVLSVAQNWSLSCMIALVSSSVIQLNSLLKLFPYLSSSTYWLSSHPWKYSSSTHSHKRATIVPLRIVLYPCSYFFSCPGWSMACLLKFAKRWVCKGKHVKHWVFHCLLNLNSSIIFKKIMTNPCVVVYL